MKWKFLCAALPVITAAASASATLAFGPTDAGTTNFDPYTSYVYTVPPNVLPTFDNTNFVIYGSFTVNYDSITLSGSSEFYEPLNTRNYTNTGTMLCNSGYRFDTQTTNQLTPHVMAASFNNSGTVSVDSLLNYLDSNITNFLFAGIGQIVVSATNVINSGTLDVGFDGYAGISGQNVDLDNGTIEVETVDSLFVFTNSFTQPTYYGFGAAGLDPTNDWNPANDLTANYSISCDPYSFILNSTSYGTAEIDGKTGFTVYKLIFVENDSTNIPYKVFTDPNNTISPLSGKQGSGYVEWDGSYLDPVYGDYVTNYLYLNIDFFGAAATNVAVFNGQPNVFTLLETPSPLFYNAGLPALGSLAGLFPNQTFTNRYSYMNGNLVAGTESTNADSSNPNGALTNLTARIQVNASNTLSMANAIFSGANYVSLTCSNGFMGSPGANVTAPFSDLNLGVTNGFLDISNLLVATIPQWTGPIEVWATRFLYVDSTGVTNDFRVAMVKDNFQPLAPPWIHNLSLHATNSLVINDVLNVYNSLFIDAQSVTLATNLIGVGASSVDGELNWESGASFGPTQMPDLLWFTNNGVFRCVNNATFENNYTGFTYLTTNYTYAGTNAIAKRVTNTVPNNWLGAFINNSLITNLTTVAEAVNFTNSGVINSGPGAFILQAGTASFVSSFNTNNPPTNSVTLAGGDMTVSATNLVLNGANITVGHALNLTASQLLTDGQSNLVVNGLTNGNVWVVGTVAVGGTDSGLNIPVNPFNGDLLGTTVTNFAPVSKNVINTWAGVDHGYSLAGYSNNLALGHLVLDASSNTLTHQIGTFTFNGNGTAGVTNAMYVDCLELQDYFTNAVTTGYNTVGLKFATNMVIYYAQAIIDGVSVAEKLNHTGADSTGRTNHLRWMPNYVGYFSYTNLVYPNGTTNAVNAALANAGDISSGDLNGGQTPNNNNGVQTYQIFVPSQINLNISLTNNAARLLTWNVPLTATNFYVQYLTNLLNPNWVTLTNFNYATNQIPLGSTNAYYMDTNKMSARFYRVGVDQWLTYPH